jgi:hypothetical protein
MLFFSAQARAPALQLQKNSVPKLLISEATFVVVSRGEDMVTWVDFGDAASGY